MRSAIALPDPQGIKTKLEHERRMVIEKPLDGRLPVPSPRSAPLWQRRLVVTEEISAGQLIALRTRNPIFETADAQLIVRDKRIRSAAFDALLARLSRKSFSSRFELLSFNTAWTQSGHRRPLLNEIMYSQQTILVSNFAQLNMNQNNKY
jgi:hypothetical protein